MMAKLVGATLAALARVAGWIEEETCYWRYADPTKDAQYVRDLIEILTAAESALWSASDLLVQKSIDLDLNCLSGNDPRAIDYLNEAKIISRLTGLLYPLNEKAAKVSETARGHTDE